jgi:hypothetical protein
MRTYAQPLSADDYGSEDASFRAGVEATINMLNADLLRALEHSWQTKERIFGVSAYKDTPRARLWERVAHAVAAKFQDAGWTVSLQPANSGYDQAGTWRITFTHPRAATSMMRVHDTITALRPTAVT